MATTSIVEDFEDTSYNFTFTGGGNLPWVRSSTRAQAGTWSYASGTIVDSQTSDASFPITIPGAAFSASISLWYWIQSESGYDYFRVLQGGVQLFQIAGNLGAWTQVSIPVSTGTTTITLRYFKDGSQSIGEDKVFVDQLTVSYTTGPYIQRWSGSTWAAKPIQTWSGSAWADKPVAFWNGSIWKPILGS